MYILLTIIMIIDHILIYKTIHNLQDKIDKLESENDAMGEKLKSMFYYIKDKG